MSTEIKIALAALLFYLLSVAAAYFIARHRTQKTLTQYKSADEALQATNARLDKTQAVLKAAIEKFKKTDAATKKLQALQARQNELVAGVKSNMQKAAGIKKLIEQLEQKKGQEQEALHALMTKLDLYTQIEGFVDHGHFEMPEYLYETAERFAEEIKLVREQQKQMISAKTAVTYPEQTSISDDAAVNKKVLGAQAKLMLTAFNIDCDKLIGRVKPSTYSATLERIEKLANSLEKSAGSMACGFDLQYVKLKFDECRLQYQYVLKKQEEAEEQRAIRDQIREEEKAKKEYQRAVAAAEKEEKMYQKLLEEAQQQAKSATEEERADAAARIEILERQLAEAQEKEQRAKSMAEQTRKGHVYVISNLGSFGRDVYKIGLTRRLDPMDRVKELGDASVPFSFDVHAMIYVEDAPALEAALHREFSESRVNLVNQRKEFFKVNLSQIRDAVGRIAGLDAEFKTTIAAEEYFETQRLRGSLANAA